MQLAVCKRIMTYPLIVVSVMFMFACARQDAFLSDLRKRQLLAGTDRHEQIRKHEDDYIVGYMHPEVLKVLKIDTKEIPDVFYHPSLEPLLLEFIHDANARGVRIPAINIKRLRILNFHDDISQLNFGASTVAVCQSHKTKHLTLAGHMKMIEWKEVLVDYDRAMTYIAGNDDNLKKIVYHELYHCFFDKGHLPSGMIGIMSPSILPIRDDNDIEQLIDDLFDPQFMQLTPSW